MSKYIEEFIKRLQKDHGTDFVEQLYQSLKDGHSLEDAQLPPDPLRTIQLRPEHDIRSRLPVNHPARRLK